MQTLTLEQLRAVKRAGGVKNVSLKAKGGGFFIHVFTYNGDEAVLTKARSAEPRLFGNPAKAISLLCGIGITVGTFDATQWHPEQKNISRVRVGQADRLREAHAAASYNKWLAKEIQDAIDDPHPSIAHEEVMARMEEEIDAMELSQRKARH